jgi:hypothetical protein
MLTAAVALPRGLRPEPLVHHRGAEAPLFHGLLRAVPWLLSIKEISKALIRYSQRFPAWIV